MVSDFPAQVRFRLSAQRALIGAVSPSWRSVSLSVDESRRKWAIRFIFTADATESDLESASCVVSEMIADEPDWSYSEEYRKCDPPEKTEPLTWLVYARCED